MSASSELVNSLDLMNVTCESVSLRDCLPLFSLSVLFCDTVPFTRWAGLTHDGLSQVCITTGLEESRPLYKNCEYLCALHCLPSNWNKPYPCLSTIPVHSQQESVFKTFDKKRVSGSNFGRPITKLYNKSETTAR